MKTKTYKHLEWNELAEAGKVTEDDLKNGMVNHIPIECPNEITSRKICCAKVWDDHSRMKIGNRQPISCQVCGWRGYRIKCGE